VDIAHSTGRRTHVAGAGLWRQALNCGFPFLLQASFVGIQKTLKT
jgi:hypothetical protein